MRNGLNEQLLFVYCTDIQYTHRFYSYIALICRGLSPVYEKIGARIPYEIVAFIIDGSCRGSRAREGQSSPTSAPHPDAWSRTLSGRKAPPAPGSSLSQTRVAFRIANTMLNSSATSKNGHILAFTLYTRVFQIRLLR